MGTVKIILQSELAKILLDLSSVLLLLVIILLIALLVLYTLYFLGKKELIYRKKSPPVKGWARRFYPANIILIGIAVAVFMIVRYLKNSY